MANTYEMFSVRVTDVEQATPLIKRFTLAREDGAAMPAFTGGSHVIVQMQGADGSQFSNAYSLMSDPRDTRSYQIGVRLEEQSKGGSAFMHQQVEVGTRLTISSPNNLFALDPSAGRHVLIAGGIGITPFLAQLHELEGGSTDYELHYAFRAPEHGAFQDQLANGPHAALIDAVIACAAQAGIAEQRVHWEQFAATPVTGSAFTVVLAQSGVELQVEEGMTILQAIEKSKAAKVECLCREGVCGTCETAILEGEAEHYDQYLSDEEKAAQQSIMLCVSRARTARLVLDL